MTTNFIPLTSARVLKKIKQLSIPKKDVVCAVNRNPRNLERLRIGYKPNGYHLEKKGKCFWHKLEIQLSARYVSATVKHFENGPVISASTSEWAIKKQLLATKDINAYINLARVLARRCQQAGITEMACHIDAVENGKLDRFLKTLQENGILLEEPERYIHPTPWHPTRPEKSWEILDEDLSPNIVNK